MIHPHDPQASLPAPTGLARVTLKNLKHCENLSQETHAFTALLCLDGVPFAHAMNEGHGGSDRYDPIKYTDEGKRLFAESMGVVDALVEASPRAERGWTDKGTGKPATIEMSLDIHVGDLINDALKEKQDARVKRDFLKKLSSTHVYFTGVASDGLRFYNMKKGRAYAPDYFANMLDHARKNQPRARILNDLSDEAAWAVAKPLIFGER